MRIYGGNLLPKDHPHRALDETGEVLVYYALAQRKLAPELYGFFPGGRIEQYIEVRFRVAIPKLFSYVYPFLVYTICKH